MKNTILCKRCSHLELKLRLKDKRIRELKNTIALLDRGNAILWDRLYGKPKKKKKSRQKKKKKGN